MILGTETQINYKTFKLKRQDIITDLTETSNLQN